MEALKAINDLTQGLTQWQREALPVIDRMVDFVGVSGRASGRTHLLAVAYIRVAVANPDVEVRVRDHFPHRDADMHLLDRIKRVVEGMDTEVRWRFRFNNHSNAFMYTRAAAYFRERKEGGGTL